MQKKKLEKNHKKKVFLIEKNKVDLEFVEFSHMVRVERFPQFSCLMFDVFTIILVDVIEFHLSKICSYFIRLLTYRTSSYNHQDHIHLETELKSNHRSFISSLLRSEKSMKWVEIWNVGNLMNVAESNEPFEIFHLKFQFNS